MTVKSQILTFLLSYLSSFESFLSVNRSLVFVTEESVFIYMNVFIKDG
jgi:hypothetical protein